MLVSAFALPGVAWADSPTLNPSGALTFSWRGDPARGCEAAGVCGVSGSLDVIPQDQLGSSEFPPSRDINIQDDSAVVRVSDPGSTPGQPHVCTDLVPIDMTLVILGIRPATLQATIAGPFATPSSGDCAGPLPVELGGFKLPARRLPGPREGYDLSGTQAFGAGPYDVTLSSTLRARRPRAGGGGGSSTSTSGSGPKPRKALVEHISLQYRISTANGGVTTTFAGRPDPLCVPFDACGVSGSLTDAVSRESTLLEFDALRVVKRSVSPAAALADLRSGRLPLIETGALFRNVLSAHVGWSAGSVCTDRLTQQNALDLVANPARTANDVSFGLTTDVEDPFRTRCPGPALGDVLGGSQRMAHGSLPLRKLGERRLHVVLSGRGRFVAGSYAGTRSGGVSLALALVRVRAATSIEPVFGGGR